jgi:hypothetical protein
VFLGAAPEPPQPGTLVAGSAQVTVNDKNLGTTDQVQCTTAGWLTMITADYGDSGVKAMSPTRTSSTCNSSTSTISAASAVATTPV